MSHSFRQQLGQTALHETASLMKAAVITLKGLNTELVDHIKADQCQLSEQTTTLLATLKQCERIRAASASGGPSSATVALARFLFFAVFVAGGVAGYLLHH